MSRMRSLDWLANQAHDGEPPSTPVVPENNHNGCAGTARKFRNLLSCDDNWGPDKIRRGKIGKLNDAHGESTALARLSGHLCPENRTSA